MQISHLCLTEDKSSMRPRRCYVAGPMRGLPLFNFPAFNHAAKVLRERGFIVTNPAEEDEKHDKLDVTQHADFNAPPNTFAFYMKRDLALICDMDCVAVLPDWWKSQGARLEVEVAIEIGIPVFIWDTGKILDPAELRGAIYRARQTPPTKSKTITSISQHPATPQTIVDRHIGIGGAPIRSSILNNLTSEQRKQYPLGSGCLDYFPDALLYVAHVSWKGNEQHNAGKPLYWDRSKSADEPDAMMRHYTQRGTLDEKGVRHSGNLAWRALAILQKELEAEAK